jgi:hypothetical protein
VRAIAAGRAPAALVGLGFGASGLSSAALLADVVMNEDCPRYNFRRDFVNVSGGLSRAVPVPVCAGSCARCPAIQAMGGVIGLPSHHASGAAVELNPRSPCSAVASSLSVIVHEKGGALDALKSLKVPFMQKVRWVA